MLTEKKSRQRIAIAFLDHGSFCNPRARPPSMQAGQDEITNNGLMTFSPSSENMVADQTGIFPLKCLTMALCETSMGYIPPTPEEMARTDFDSHVFAVLRTLDGKCTRHCQWLLAHDCVQVCCVLPPSTKVCASAPRAELSSDTDSARDSPGETGTHRQVQQQMKTYPCIHNNAESLSTAC